MTTAPADLRADDLFDPCGLPLRPPRLRWLCTDPRPAEIQSAWQVQAASSVERLAQVPDLWDSGKVDGGEPAGVEYAGRGVAPARQVWWRVRTFDSDGVASPWSEPAHFEFSIPPEDWIARWIAAPMRGAREQSPPVPLLRRRFRVGFVPVRTRLYVAVAGACRIWINESELDLPEVPSGFTDYRSRIACRTFHVDGLVRSGAGSITVLLGDGYFSGYADGRSREHFGTRPELRVQLVIEGAAGETCAICSDAEWEWRTSPLLRADLALGAAIDGRAFGNHPEYARQKRQWQPVDVFDRPERRLLPMAWSGVLQRPGPFAGRIVQRGGAQPGECRWWVQFPETLFGRAVLTLKGGQGCFVRVRYGHLRDGEDQPLFDGTVVDHYTLSGDDPHEVISFPFTRRLFRHLEITGDAGAGALIAVEARSFGLPVEERLQVQSDHPLIERLAVRFSRTLDILFQEQLWKGAGVERRRANLAVIYPLFGTLLLQSGLQVPLRAWLDELLAGETGLSGLPESVPQLRTSGRTETGIGSAGMQAASDRAPETGFAEVLPALALELSRHTGNRSVLGPVFALARRLVFTLEQSCPDLIRALPEDASCRSPMHAAMLGTALFHDCVENTARIAGLLDLGTQAESFHALAERVKVAFRRRFVTPDGLIVANDQDACVTALSFGLLEEDAARQVFESLCSDVIRSGYRCETHPLLGTRVLDVLSSGGRHDLAWALALRVDDASWLGPAGRSPDVLTSADGDLSLRDAALIGWLVESGAGFSTARTSAGDEGGWSRVVIAPRLPVGNLFPEGASLRRLRVRLLTDAGEWRIGWQIHGQSVSLDVQVPCGCNAQLILPDATVKRLVAGSHEFRVGTGADDEKIPLLSETL